MLCRDIMKTDVECVLPEESCLKAAQRMRDRNLGFVAVCDENMAPLGTLTDRDLCLRICADDKTASQVRANEVMTPGVVSCAPEDDLTVAEERMAQHHKSRILVTENGRIVGVLSLSDIAQVEPEGRVANTLKEISSREIQA